MTAASASRSPLSATRPLAGLLLAALAALAIPRAAGAVSTGVYYELGNESSQNGNTYLAPTWVTDTTGAPSSTSQALGSATAQAFAAPGVLKASLWDGPSVSSLPATGVSERAFSHAIANFYDRITITSSNPALTGSTVTVNASFLLTGSLSAGYHIEDNNSLYFDTRASTFLNVSGTGISGFVSAREIHSNSGGMLTDVSTLPPSSIPIQFTVQIGSSTSIQYQLDLQGDATASFGFRECGGGYGPCGALASATVASNFANSMLWGGISSITDSNGDPITGLSVGSDSGFDYSVPVPEPASATLVAMGMALLAAAARRPGR